MLTTPQSYVVYQGNAVTTSFPFNFPIPNAGCLVVSITNNNVSPAATTVLSASQYSVTGLGNSSEFTTGAGMGGVVTYPNSGNPLPAGWSITIQRIVPYQQNTSLANQGAFYPEVVEGALDYLTMLAQQIAAGAASTSPVLPSWISGLVTLTDANGNVNSQAPSLSALAPVYKTANTSATTMTGFTNMTAGHYFKVIFGDANTTVGFGQGGATLIGNNSVNWTPGVGDFMDCVSDGTHVYCITSGTLATLESYIQSYIAAHVASLVSTAVAATFAAYYPALTNSTASLPSNVSMTTANTFYDGPSLTLTAGTWLVFAVVLAGEVLGAYTAKLWDGTTVYAVAEQKDAGTSAAPLLQLSTRAVIVLASPDTIKISATCTVASAIMYALPPDNGGSVAGSNILAIRIA